LNATGEDSSQGRDSFKFDTARETIRARSPRYALKLSLVGFKAKHGLFGLRNNGSRTLRVFTRTSLVSRNKKRFIRHCANRDYCLKPSKGQLPNPVGPAQLPDFARQTLEAPSLRHVRAFMHPAISLVALDPYPTESAARNRSWARSTPPPPTAMKTSVVLPNHARVALRDSGENLFDLFVAPSSRRLEPPQIRGGSVWEVANRSPTSRTCKHLRPCQTGPPIRDVGHTLRHKR
jgi:hypothetical protein